MANKKVLVVDDEREVTLSLEGFFSALGYNMLTAFDGQEALDVISKNKLDLMLLDIRMPGIDGKEVLKRVRKSNPEIKVIVITAYGREVKDEVTKLGVDGFFEKPIDLSKIMNHIQRVLEPGVFPAGSPPDKSETFSTKVPKAKVLFVQPSPITYGYTCGYFAGHDNMTAGFYEIKVTYDAREAMRLLYDYQPDLVIIYDCFFNAKDAEDFGAMIMNSSHKPKSVILHGLMPRDQFEVLQLEKAGIKFCNQNVMSDENLRRSNKALVDFVKGECLKHDLVQDERKQE